ncbi:MAG: hypothetical protein JSS11_17450 [Verrucomicrobia bacterium]|nr:hypothetical protein [Verrucomicrobiota bacterium]
MVDLWNRLTESQRDLCKIAGGLLVLTPVVLLTLYLAKPQVQRWQRDQALAEARAFTAKKDYRNALVAFHRVIDKSPTDIESWKQVADFLSETGSPEVLVARRNLVWLAPDDISLRLGFVLDALRFGDVNGASEVVGGVKEGAREEVAFYRMAAALAYAQGRTAEFEANIEELLRRQPADHNAALDLATLRLWGADATRVAAARQTLLELLREPDVRVRAAVELLKYVARTGTRADADALVAVLHRALLNRPPPPPGDPGAAAEPPGWFTVVEALKAGAAGSANDAAVLARWLAAIGQPREALVWLDGLNGPVQRSPLVAAAAMELSLMLDDASRLRPLLLDGAWGRAPLETVDLAFAARWERKLGKTDDARATWANALESANESLPALRVLARLAVAWGDPEGAQAAMLAVIKRYPAERWAWEALRIEYSRKSDTPKLRALYDKWVASPVTNRFIEQDWVILNFLTGQPAATVFERAKALHEAEPLDPVAALGYAMALRAQKKPREAFLAIDGLVGEDRTKPRALLWRGILLAELGRRAEARQTLAAVEIARLLPEEVRLGREFFGQTAPVALPAAAKASSAPAATGKP